MTRRALTLIEVIAICAILAVLAALLLVAIGGARESTRKISCSNNIRNMMLATQNYVSLHSMFPPGNDSNHSYSVHTRLLPFVGEQALYDAIDFRKPYESQRRNRNMSTPSIYICPSDPEMSATEESYLCNYIGIAGGSTAARQNGIFVSGYLGAVSPAGVTDGMSNTLAATESRAYLLLPPDTSRRLAYATYKSSRRYALPSQLGEFITECEGDSELSLHGRSLGSDWMFGSLGVTRLIAVLPRQSRNCANVGSLSRALIAPSSTHPGGVYAGRADGSVQFVDSSVDARTWRSLSSRNDGEVIQMP